MSFTRPPPTNNPKREIGSFVKIDNEKRTANIIGNNAVVKGDIVLGEGVVIGSMVLVEGTDIQIGDGTKFMPFCAIGSKMHIGKNCFFGPFFSPTNAVDPGPDAILEDLFIGDNCIFGANVLVEPGITIGNNVKVAMGAFIDADVPDGFFVPRLGAPRPRNDL